MGHKIRVYADTSVFGGVFDAEFARPSRLFFERVREGRFELVVSPVVQEEIHEGAPLEVREFFESILTPFGVAVPIRSEAIELQKGYLKSRILSPKWGRDALHVALATVHQCRMIISWNFKHLVHFQKIPLFNGVNALFGYPPIQIFSPLEVIEDDD